MTCQYPFMTTRFFSIAGLAILLLLSVIATLATILAPYSPDNRYLPFLAPSLLHLLGTDDLGHDIFSQLLFAARVSLSIGVLAAVVAVGIGTTVGILSGYFRGILSELLTGIIDIFLLIPALPFMIVLTAYLGTSIWNIVLVIALLSWCSTARVVQTRTLQLRETPFIEALRALGISRRQIIFKHIVKNTADVITAKFILAVAHAMLSEAALSFIGLGDPAHISWGTMMYYAFRRGGFINGLWNWYLPPGFCIALTTMGFMLLGFYWERKNEYQTSEQVWDK